MDISFDLVQQLHDSQEVVDFDWAWQVLGYSTKGNAKRMLVKYFDENFDYFVQSADESLESLPYGVFLTSDKNSKEGRPTENIYLTVECFKEMGMLARSEQGRQIRKYFLRCEAIAKQSVSAIPQMQQAILAQNAIMEQHTQAIAQLQQQIAELQTQSTNPGNQIPPGWDKETWEQLPSQDKRHFRFLYRRRGFNPSTVQNKPLLLPDSLKQQQIEEMQKLVGEVSEDEQQKMQKAKESILEKFWNENF